MADPPGDRTEELCTDIPAMPKHVNDKQAITRFGPNTV
jgi:hypothetical protein